MNHDLTNFQSTEIFVRKNLASPLKWFHETFEWLKPSFGSVLFKVDNFKIFGQISKSKLSKPTYF